MTQATKDNAHRIIMTSSYAEKQQALVDSMLATWQDLEAGLYGFKGYDSLHKMLDKLTEEQQIEVANAIIDRRNDKEKGLV